MLNLSDTPHCTPRSHRSRHLRKEVPACLGRSPDEAYKFSTLFRCLVARFYGVGFREHKTLFTTMHFDGFHLRGFQELRTLAEDVRRFSAGLQGSDVRLEG